jgi:predicted HNH restriction endonuclease
VKAKRRIPAKTRVRSALRRLWMISPERSDCLRAWGYKCADCGAKQSVAKGRECKLDVHHLDGIDWGEVKGNDVTQLFPDPSRLVPLCKACHKARHAKGHDDDAE